MDDDIDIVGLRDRIRKRLEATNISARKASKAAGQSESFVKNILDGRSLNPSIGRLNKLAMILNTTPGWLLKEEGEEETRSFNMTTMPRDSVVIDELDTRAGAGGGGWVQNESILEGGDIISAEIVRAKWVIPNEFLRQLRMNGGRRICIIEVYGDSGYDPGNSSAPGSLLPNDRVIVDLDDIMPSPPGPFVVHDGIGLVVKLVEAIQTTWPPRLRLSSRNPSYHPVEVTTEEARIIGRVRGRISAM